MRISYKSGWMVMAAALAMAPAAANAQAARDSGLIVSSVEQAVRQPAARIENFALTVDVSDRALYVMSGERVVRRFPVSVGEDNWPTPTGSFRIRHMIWNPSWTPPPSSWARGKKREEPGSPGNPMGRVKMFFQEPDYYIHGSGAISSLGNARSHGCIRMRNEDAVELARLVMINGGDPRNPEWFQQTIANRTTSRDVVLPRPVPVRIRA
ncbi:MAG TPA: L,D-transpeptidase [Longimicrobium sp.]|jgi:lipoprotein-anchoring transpeptidase ErfK/SrfK|uniref:L,D-transpeptidase n=1 Tax=Longimicrobium sp. TaxID=2029185 RepID=UPI002ED96068